MADANVLNRFETPGPGKDNPLVLDGTVTTSNGANLKTKIITVVIPDISTSPFDTRFIPGFAGTIVNHSAVITEDTKTNVTIVTLIQNAAGSLVPNLVITGNNAGDSDQAVPTLNNTIGATDSIQVDYIGSNTLTANVTITFEILPS